MKKALNFLKSPLGKTLIILVVVVVVVYIAYTYYQKSIYGGLTKSGVEDRIKLEAAKGRISYIQANDTNVLTNKYPLADVLEWYDTHGGEILGQSQISSVLSSLKIDPERRSDFDYLMGQQVILTQYVENEINY